MIYDNIRHIIYGEEETRIRATWRILLGLILVLFLPQLLVPLIAFATVGDPMGQHLLMSIFMFFMTAMALIFLVGFARFIDRRPVREYGLNLSRSWWLDGLAGFITPLVVFTVYVGLSLFFGWISVESITDESFVVLAGWGVLFFLVYILGGAIAEGIAYTGIVGQNLAEGARAHGGSAQVAVATAVIGGGLLFSILHFFVYGDPGAFGELPLSGPVFIWFAVGSVMVLSYFWTGNAAFAIGVNAGANMGGWLFHPGDGLPGIPHVIMIEHNPPAPFDAVGGTLAVSWVIGLAILAAWVYYRKDSITHDTGEIPQSL
ncbi:hypothetical protein QA600_22700 [Natronococcus sp. A-GB1]|uniref:CPBP family glutamic-type intramembrane protease n=1 Tax=Natronococcus sp. A-GB1 TaxID=3037648 RepID=UPI00241E87F6|nr:CPBP family glutamic-type intramembrane protease [Natronococcus sp. A-GB1]MDG5762127.1 hypothetical protein [Natronococcus sp. A-GB1]